jgi:ubiquinone/menaquinone biosynthesis C-methylase UbiE
MTDSREGDLERIRETYAAYDRDGRDRLWDRTNPGYDRLKSEAEARILDLVRASLVNAGDEILDVGCGDGDLAALSRSAGVEAPWTGLDLLPSRISSATERVPDARFVVGSADAMPFDHRTFQVVCAITLFSSLPSRALEAAVATEIRRVIRPGGWLVWHDLRYGNPSNPAVHGVTTARLHELFEGWRFELRSFTLIPPIARRLGPTTPVTYPILHAVPALRSHLIGRLRCPS